MNCGILTIVCVAAALCCCSSASSNSSAFLDLRNQYQNAVQAESVDEQSHSKAQAARHEAIQTHGREFWHSYATLRESIGEARAERLLKSLVAEFGLATILLVPTSSAERHSSTDALIDRWIVEGSKPTRYLGRVLGEPPDSKRVQGYREGARLFGTKLILIRTWEPL